MTTDSQFQKLIKQKVVLDVSSLYVYVGTLEAEDQHYLVLNDADAHDLRDTETTRERYVLESKRHGINSNRKQVFVRKDEVVSISALDDVVE